MTFEIIRDKLNLLLNGEKLRHPTWEKSDYIRINAEGKLKFVDQYDKEMSFEMFDNIAVVKQLVKFDPACHSLTDALLHFAKTGRGFRRNVTHQGGVQKIWSEGSFGSSVYSVINGNNASYVFTIEDVTAQNYELL